MGSILTFFASGTLREWAFGLAILGAGIFASWYTVHERDIGADEIRAHDLAVQQAAQAAIDKNAADANAKIQAAYNASRYDPINYQPAVDCGSVPDAIRLRVNGAGKAGKH